MAPRKLSVEGAGSALAAYPVSPSPVTPCRLLPQHQTNGLQSLACSLKLAKKSTEWAGLGVPRHSSATCGSSGAPQVALGGPAGPWQVTLLSAANCSQKRSCDMVGAWGAGRPLGPPGRAAGEPQPHDRGRRQRAQQLRGTRRQQRPAGPICMRVSHRLRLPLRLG